MTQRKDTALAHPVDPNKWARIRQAERVTYAGAVAAPQRSDWAGTLGSSRTTGRSVIAPPPDGRGTAAPARGRSRRG